MFRTWGAVTGLLGVALMACVHFAEAAGASGGASPAEARPQAARQQAAAKAGASGINLSSSPANEKLRMPLLFNFTTYWSELIAKGDLDPQEYFNVGTNDARNKCVPEGCTRTLTNFGGRPAMAFTTHAGYNYSAFGRNAPEKGGKTDGQVSTFWAEFVRRSRKSYDELMMTADVFIPANANWFTYEGYHQDQDQNAQWAGGRCMIGAKTVLGIMAGQVDPLPLPGPTSGGWRYVVKQDQQNATQAIAGVHGFGSRQCSAQYGEFLDTGQAFAFWDIDDNPYLEAIPCETWEPAKLPRNRWFTFEVYGKLDTNGENGMIAQYVDGKRTCQHTRVNWGGSRGWRFVAFGGVFMFGGGNDYYVPRDTTSIYYSNVRVFGR